MKTFGRSTAWIITILITALALYGCEHVDNPTQSLKTGEQTMPPKDDMAQLTAEELAKADIDLDRFALYKTIAETDQLEDQLNTVHAAPFNPPPLRNGDILFGRGDGSFGGIYPWGYWKHTGVAIQRGSIFMVIEAIDKGVVAIRTPEQFANDYYGFSIARVKNISSSDLTRVTDKLWEQLGEPFWFNPSVKTPFLDPYGFYCSGLAWYGYNRGAGRDLDATWWDAWITPDDIYNDKDIEIIYASGTNF